MRSVVITGTSSGIGWGTAKILIAHGFRVFGSVRKTSDAERLAAEFGERFVPLLFDVTDEAAVKAAAADVRSALAGQRLTGLVNNEGVAVAGPLLELPTEEFRRQIDINLIGVVITTKAFAPLIGTDPQLTGPPAVSSTSVRSAGRSAIPSSRPTTPRNSGSKDSPRACDGSCCCSGSTSSLLRPAPSRRRSGAKPSRSTPRHISARRMLQRWSACEATCWHSARRVCRRKRSAKRCCTHLPLRSPRCATTCRRRRCNIGSRGICPSALSIA